MKGNSVKDVKHEGIFAVILKSDYCRILVLNSRFNQNFSKEKITINK